MSDQKPRRLARDELLAKRVRAAENSVLRDAAHEEDRVKFLLSKLNMPKKKWTMLQVSKERTGEGKLTLSLFNEMCPNFPLLLAMASVSKVDKLHLDSKATLPAIIRRFQDVPFVKEYETTYEQLEPIAAGRAVALLFNRKGIIRGMVMHNGEGLEDYWVPGAGIVYNGGTREDPTQLFVQSFASLIEAIHRKGHGWKPEFAF